MFMRVDPHIYEQIIFPHLVVKCPVTCLYMCDVFGSSVLKWIIPFIFCVLTGSCHHFSCVLPIKGTS